MQHNPRLLGSVALAVAERIGHIALAYQLDQAARSSGAAAARAQREADGIADVLGLGEPLPLPHFARGQRARGEAA